MKIKPIGWLVLLLAGSAIGTLVFVRDINFSRRLADDELAAVLADGSPSRKAMHGITELTERWREGQPGMDRWVERLVSASRRPEASVRRTAAWAMQLGAKDASVAARLREIVADDVDPVTRRNAACALSLADDPVAARPVLRSMLESWLVVAPAGGTVESLIAVGRRAKEDEMAGRMRGAAGDRVEVPVLVPGRVVEVLAKAGDQVAAGSPLLRLAPDPAHVTNAAAALTLAGSPDDVELLRTMLQPGAEMPSGTAVQVHAAIEAIERRARK
ncbi:MAG: hypothetical protein K8T90_13930 [Planctomycetes bacterium]|nr:hypothetical protein [Planctomycetota bacterium]